MTTTEHLENALERTPHDAALLIQYGHQLLKAGRRQEALAVASRAERGPINNAGAWDALGTLLTHLEEPARAATQFRRAVEAAPENIDFRYNLAMVQRMLGDLASSEANLDVVIAARPYDGEAYQTRSDLRKQTVDRNHVIELERALRNATDRRAWMAMSFALAKELDDLGDYSRSFEHLHRACRAYRSSLNYRVADDLAVLEKLCQEHTADVLARRRTDFDNEECIFIVGLPRSGTTLVERILGSHREVYAAGELDAFPQVVVEAVGRGKGAPVKKLDFVSRALEVDFQQLGSAYLQATRPRTGHTPKFTDKLPLNYLYAGLISAALPRARFIAMHRHPVDSCYAMYKTLFATAYPFTYDLDDLGQYYLRWSGLMRHWASVLGDRWLPVKYEELVLDPEAVSRRILAHCGLAWDMQCLSFHTRAAAVTTASAAQVRRPIYGDSVGKWQRYAEQLAPLVLRFEANGIAVR